MDLGSDEVVTKLGDVAAEAGLRRVHVLAWRDLDDPEAGGSEVHADRIAALWAEAGIDVVLRTSRAEGHPACATRSGYRVARRGGRLSTFPDAVARELLGRDGRRDGLVEVWNGMPYFAPLWARGPRIAFVHHVHAEMWRQVLTPARARLGEAIELRIAPRVYRGTRVLTPSSSARRTIIDRLGLAPDRVSVVPNGIDGAFCAGGRRSATPLVVAAGRLVPHKHIDAVIRAVDRIRHRHPDAELVVVGEGWSRPGLEDLVAQLGAGGWVHFTGRVDDDTLIDWYRRAWVLAGASTSEGWGLTITEAAGCRTPAVVSRIDGHVDAVVHDVTGLLVDGDDELAAALGRVIAEPDLRRRLGAAAAAHAATFTWQRTALGVLEALAAEALECRARRARRARRSGAVAPWRSRIA